MQRFVIRNLWNVVENFEREDISAFQSFQRVKSEQDENMWAHVRFAQSFLQFLFRQSPGGPFRAVWALAVLRILEKTMELPLEQVDSDRLVANVDEWHDIVSS